MYPSEAVEFHLVLKSYIKHTFFVDVTMDNCCISISYHKATAYTRCTLSHNFTVYIWFTGRVFNGSGKPVDKGPSVCAEDFLDIQGG